MKRSASRTSSPDIGPEPKTPAGRRRAAVLGSIPGLERLLPGHYRPGGTVTSRYGTWILPKCFKGHPLCAIIDGTMIG